MLRTVQWFRLFLVLSAIFIVLGYNKFLYNPVVSIEYRPREGAIEVGAHSSQLGWVGRFEPSGFTVYSLEQNILQNRAAKGNPYHGHHDPLQNSGPQLWRRVLQKAELALVSDKEQHNRDTSPAPDKVEQKQGKQSPHKKSWADLKKEAPEVYLKRLERHKAYRAIKKQQDPEWWERRKERVRERYKRYQEDPEWRQRRNENRKKIRMKDPEKFRAQRRKYDQKERKKQSNSVRMKRKQLQQQRIQKLGFDRYQQELDYHREWRRRKASEDPDWRERVRKGRRQQYRKKRVQQKSEPKVVSGAEEAAHKAKSESSMTKQDSPEVMEIASEVKQAKLSRSQEWSNRLKEQNFKAWETFHAKREASKQRRAKEKSDSYMRGLERKREYYKLIMKNHPEKYQKRLMSSKQSYKRRKAMMDELLPKSQQTIVQKTKSTLAFSELELQRHSEGQRRDREKAEALETTQKMEIDHPRESSPDVQLDAAQKMEGDGQRESSPKVHDETSQRMAAKHQSVDLAALWQDSDIDDALRHIGFPPSP